MKTIDAELFWARIDELRNGKNLSLIQLCEKGHGLVYRTLTQQRTRNILPSVEVLALLAEALDTTVDYLVFGIRQGDPLYRSLDEKPRIKKIAGTLLECQDIQLSIIEALFMSWGYASKEDMERFSKAHAVS